MRLSRALVACFLALALPAFAAEGGPAAASQFTGDLDDSPEWFRKADDTIAQLQDLVKSLPPNSDQRATRTMQLAELQWEKAKRLRQRAVRRLNEKHDRGDLDARLADEPAE